jgi:predicted N-acyltransferase
MHEIADARFREAIGDWLAREREARLAWFGEAVRHLPFRRDGKPATLDPDVRDRLAPED